MTAVIERPQEKKGRQRVAKPRGASALGAPALPQVDLLPPEIRAGRGLAMVKRWLAIGLVATIVVAGMLYGWAFLQRQGAEDRLTEAQDRSMALSKEKAQYVEVTQVLKGIKDTEAAAAFGGITSVTWSPYIQAIAAVLPDDVTIQTFSVQQGSPTAPFVDSSDPLSTELGIATIRFTSRSATLPVASEWLDALESIPSFVDPSLQSSRIEDDDGSSYYAISSTIQVDATAFDFMRLLEGE